MEPFKSDAKKPNLPNSKGLKLQKLISKKWFFPALYLSVAAIILGGVFLFKEYDFNNLKQQVFEDNSIPVEENVVEQPEFISPVGLQNRVVTTIGFYDDSVSQEKKKDYLIKYSNTYWPHTGLDFSSKDGKTFDVLASFDGEVVRVEENPVVGLQVEIEHKDGIVTVYQSLSDVVVKKGQIVKKGQVIAKAGNNSFEKDEGIHLHFEVRKDNKVINPKELIANL